MTIEHYSTITSSEPVNTLTCYPGFNLEDPGTSLVLSTAAEQPIRLNSALTGARVASYPLINAHTEAYIRPQSLLFTQDGSCFLAGSDNLISTFELSRPGDEPVLSLQTGPKRSRGHWLGTESVVRGIISALSIDHQHNVLAIGTLSRQIGLYDAVGRGGCFSAWSLVGTEAADRIGGTGITQLRWSTCRRYLYAAERRSNGFIVHDIRNTSRPLSWLEGRNADTNQRMTFDTSHNKLTGKEEIWAGGIDGMVKRWTSPGEIEGSIEADAQYNLHDSTSLFVRMLTSNGLQIR